MVLCNILPQPPAPDEVVKASAKLGLSRSRPAHGEALEHTRRIARSRWPIYPKPVSGSKNRCRGGARFPGRARSTDGGFAGTHQGRACAWIVGVHAHHLASSPTACPPNPLHIALCRCEPSSRSARRRSDRSATNHQRIAVFQTLRWIQINPCAPAPDPPDGPAGLSHLTRSATPDLPNCVERPSPPTSSVHPDREHGCLLTAESTKAAALSRSSPYLRRQALRVQRSGSYPPIMGEYHTQKYAPRRQK